MKADRRFLRQPRPFWANVRTISQEIGYTVRGAGIIRVPTLYEIAKAYQRLGLSIQHIQSVDGAQQSLGKLLLDYFAYRANILNTYVEPRLMDADQAREVFHDFRARLNPDCPLPINKQKGAKKAPAYLTGLINMLIQAHSRLYSCDFNPRQLTTVTRDGLPLRTLSRRIDGAFPSTVNPVAVWEVKEYYYTTTFGSRVADGIYETLLDGMELAELKEHEGIEVKNYLMVDSHYTWWKCGRSYLCRIIDMLHMGYMNEALFGYEVVERLPEIVESWTKTLRSRQRQRG
ncbi:MAG TPA: hypothetical protein VLX28_02875 [Thermoanaerobaculia bacterium]|nr:hypothetical protein [Thermoanaerobaculia bacterium]